MGTEATILAMESELGPAADSTPRPQAYVICFGDEVRVACFELLQELRRAGVAADMDFENRSPKAQMRAANRRGAALCLLIGPDELERNEVTIKDMADGSQRSVPREQVLHDARSQLGLPGGNST